MNINSFFTDAHISVCFPATADPINEPLAQKTEENHIHFIEKSLEYGRY
jgi:hypothetical protein